MFWCACDGGQCSAVEQHFILFERGNMLNVANDSKLRIPGQLSNLYMNQNTVQESTETSKQPIRTRYLGHVTGYQPISDQYFLIRSVPVNVYLHPWFLKIEGGSETTQPTVINNTGCFNNMYTVHCHWSDPILARKLWSEHWPDSTNISTYRVFHFHDLTRTSQHSAALGYDIKRSRSTENRPKQVNNQLELGI
eukprot:sb/3470969/